MWIGNLLMGGFLAAGWFWFSSLPQARAESHRRSHPANPAAQPHPQSQRHPLADPTRRATITPGRPPPRAERHPWVIRPANVREIGQSVDEPPPGSLPPLGWVPSIKLIVAGIHRRLRTQHRCAGLRTDCPYQSDHPERVLPIPRLHRAKPEPGWLRAQNRRGWARQRQQRGFEPQLALQLESRMEPMMAAGYGVPSPARIPGLRAGSARSSRSLTKSARRRSSVTTAPRWASLQADGLIFRPPSAWRKPLPK